MPKPLLGYWKFRGLAQPARLMLKYVGEDFEDRLYELGDGPAYSRQAWLKDKDSLGLDSPNLPYYIDGDIKITQSNAIYRHIARKHNLCGETDQERASVDMMCENAMDFRNGFVRFCYNPRADKNAYLKDLKVKLAVFAKCLGDKDWFAGSKITFPDFHMYELLDQHRSVYPDCLDEEKKLQDFMERFEAIPAINSYMASDQFMMSPINNKTAKIGSK